MGMDWLKGIVGASDRMIPAGQQPPAAWTPYGAPPGAPGAPGAPYAVPQAYGAPQGYAVPPSPYATPAAPAGPPIGGAPQAPTPPAAVPSSDGRVAALEAQCSQLRHDIEAIALFARTLLTLLEEKQITTPEQFAETKKKIDLLDGKLDDRAG